jgi:DNA polymerase-4
MVSGIAAHILPPSEGMLDVAGGREAAFMAPLDVQVIPGIGKVRRHLLLEEFGIIQVRQLAALDAGRLTLIFGSRAYVIRQRALGVDPTPVYPPAVEPVVQESVVFAPDENDDRKLLGALYRLVERCAARLRRKALTPRRGGILVRYSDDVEVGRAASLCCTSALDAELYPPLEALFFKVCARRVRVRKMKVRFRDFSFAVGQLSLFAAPSPIRRRNQRLGQAVDHIRERFGEDAIQRGRTI